MIQKRNIATHARQACITAAAILLAAHGVHARAAVQAECVNLSTDQLRAVSAVLKTDGFATIAVEASTKRQKATRLVIWEAAAKSDISATRAAELGEFVRTGGSLLLTLSRDTGAGPMQLAFMLPTTAWHTQLKRASRGDVEGPVSAAESDNTLFSSDIKLSVPYHFTIRPFDAAERGLARYETFERTIQYTGAKQKPGDTFWTRPLLNRDWQIRLRGDDAGRSPLLITGRYGAGRVAVFGSSADSLANSPEVLRPLIQWLTTSERTTESTAPAVDFTSQIDAANHTLRIQVQNRSSQSAKLQLIARISTWERAPVGDHVQRLTVAANGQIDASIPLPRPGDTGYQALDARDAFDVRVGLLTERGDTLLVEKRIPVDFRTGLRLSLMTDNLRQIAYPFHAPDPDSLDRSMPKRLGAPVGAYAYKPGQKIQAEVTLFNGCHNIAPLAATIDETQPDNPTLRALTDDAAHAEKTPRDVTAYGTWVGKPGSENILRFDFSSPITARSVVLNLAPTNHRFYLLHNPGKVVIEADGVQIAADDTLDARAIAENGLVRIAFAPVQARTIRVKFPWDTRPVAGRARTAPWLGELQIEGTPGTASRPAAITDRVRWQLKDALSGETFSAPESVVTVDGVASVTARATFTAPPLASGPRYLILLAAFAGQIAERPILVIDPQNPLTPLSDLRPDNAPSLGFIVTRGFRNVFDIGTGTQQTSGAWGEPDDLIWAYSRMLKQIPAHARTQASRLYLSDSDMRHYSTPWRSFPNGEYFYNVAAPHLLARMKQDRNWNKSDLVVLSHSDRWDTGPAVDQLFSWQDLIDFDEHLQATYHKRLSGKTRQELCHSISGTFASEWQKWQLQRYVHAVRTLRDTFAAEGKRLLITAQGTPLLPLEYVNEFGQLIRGMSDDSSWGMEYESVPFTTGRQMGVMAVNPGWALSTLLQWGWDSAILNNMHWHAPVGTTEPSRRHQYDRAWRGTLTTDGQYRSMHTYGYNMNGGVSFTMTDNDWQQCWYVQERHSLLAPQAPIGAALLTSADELNNPESPILSGGGMGEGNAATRTVRQLADAVQRLQDAGIAIPFATIPRHMEKYRGNAPMIVIDASNLSDSEIAILSKRIAAGEPLAAFAGEKKLSPAANRLFGVNETSLQTIGGNQVILSGKTTLIMGRLSDMSPTALRPIAALLQSRLRLPIEYPLGTSGYGFWSQGKAYIVVEDWYEQGRTVTVKYRPATTIASLAACALNTHAPLRTRQDGDTWLIDLPLKPGDGDVICIQETP